METQTQEVIFYPAIILDQSIVNSLEGMRTKIKLLLGAIRYNVPGEHLNNIIINELADIRKAVIDDIINIRGTEIIPEPEDLPTIQRVTYSSILLSFVIQDRYYCRDLIQVLEMALKMRDIWKGFLFCDLFFLLIDELYEMTNLGYEIENTDETQKITVKYDQQINKYLLDRNGKIDDCNFDVNSQIFQKVQEKLDKSK